MPHHLNASPATGNHNMTRYYQPPLVYSIQAQQPNDVIRKVHDGAVHKYRIIKKKKQEELSYKIVNAQETGDKALLKNEKKRVDNHASAVASRERQVYLVASFEELVRTKMNETVRLAELVRTHISESARLAELVGRHEAASEKKDSEIKKMQARIAQLLREVSNLKGHIPTSSTTAKSATALPHRGNNAWLGSGALSLESLPHGGGGDGDEHLDELGRSDVSLADGLDGETTNASDNVFSAYLEEAAAHASMGDGLKVDGVLPESGAVIAFRRNTTWAQLSRADVQEDVFYDPVA